MKKRIMSIITVVVMAVVMMLSFAEPSYAYSPSFDTVFKKLKVGSNQISYNSEGVDRKDPNYGIAAGSFTAPEAGKYTISVVNNGYANLQNAYVLNADFATIDSVGKLGKTDKYTFKTIYLRKNQKVYIYSTGSYDSNNSTASRVVIKKMSTTPKMSKSTLSLKKGKSYTLKVSNAKKPIIWVSGNRRVVTVTSRGIVKAKNRGVAYVYAITNNKLAMCRVTVK